MGDELARFSEALNSICYLHNPVIKMDEALVLSLCDRFLSKSEADQRRLSEIFETLSTNDRYLELNSLGLSEVKERLTCLDQFNQGQRSDRKSTRLNSSHVRISYAVFCLIKKKK